MNTNTTLKIGRREFKVTSETKFSKVRNCEEVVYTLEGVRGARYFTMRNVNKPHMMFICNDRAFGMAAGYESVWLTDKNGVLEVL